MVGFRIAPDLGPGPSMSPGASDATKIAGLRDTRMETATGRLRPCIRQGVYFNVHLKLCMMRNQAAVSSTPSSEEQAVERNLDEPAAKIKCG